MLGEMASFLYTTTRLHARRLCSGQAVAVDFSHVSPYFPGVRGLNSPEDLSSPMALSLVIRLSKTGAAPLNLEAELSDTVLSLKEAILSIVKEPTWRANTCRLLFNGKDLDITKTLGESGMTEGYSVSLHLLGPAPTANSVANTTTGGSRPNVNNVLTSITPANSYAMTAASSIASLSSSAAATTTSSIPELVTLRHALGVALAERDAARGEVKSLQERLLQCEERLHQTATAFDIISVQLTQLSGVASEARSKLFFDL